MKPYHCHVVALFGYSEHHPPLSVSYTQAAVTSGRKFLDEIISSWPQYIERVSFHKENKGISSNSQIGEESSYELVRLVQFFETRGRQYGHITITLFI
jgi:hypothetical protein